MLFRKTLQYSSYLEPWIVTRIKSVASYRIVGFICEVLNCANYVRSASVSSHNLILTRRLQCLFHTVRIVWIEIAYKIILETFCKQFVWIEIAYKIILETVWSIWSLWTDGKSANEVETVRIVWIEIALQNLSNFNSDDPHSLHFICTFSIWSKTPDTPNFSFSSLI